QCAQFRSVSEAQSITPEKRAEIASVFERLSDAGYRALGVATRSAEPRAAYAAADETAMVFEGFVTFQDPPKPEVGQAIKDLEADGVDVKILTGDNERIARSVCVAVGLDPGEIVS